MRILAVDDDAEYLEMLCIGLEEHGLEATPARDVPEAKKLLQELPRGHFEVLFLDVQMPGTSGLELLAELREAGDEVPVLFVTGLKETADKLRGFELGADDYLVKPFDVEELVARAHAVVRRRSALEPLEYGDVRMDLARRTVERNGKHVDLSPREYDLLYTLIRAKGAIVSREELLREVWKIEFDPGTNLIDVHLGRLRRKVDRQGRPLIHNERGKGFFAVAHDSAG
jgi:two-component system OmpR family response regulator